MINRRTLQFISATLAVGAITFLSACDPEDEAGSATAPTATTVALVEDRIEPTSTPPWRTTAPLTEAAPELDDETMEVLFIMVLDDSNIPYKSEDWAIELGHTICESFEADLSFVEIGETIRESGYYDAYEAWFVIGSSIGAFCPEFESSIPQG